ncbi:PTS glucose/sucrose transporter subunit IIB [Streptomyces sp. NPDC005921]|uniref:PTS glucose/sucrose transporter subunit IIB n=1 Tax=Streptomyces sp. NPDC005827 TaxID=3157070 RepID=UPI0033EB26AF
MSSLGADFAPRLLRLVGGTANVSELTHCMARLRFVLHDDTLADDRAIEALPEVVLVVRQSGQLQLVVTVPVTVAHAEVLQHLAGDSAEKEEETE